MAGTTASQPLAGRTNGDNSFLGRQSRKGLEAWAGRKSLPPRGELSPEVLDEHLPLPPTNEVSTFELRIPWVREYLNRKHLSFKASQIGTKLKFWEILTSDHAGSARNGQMCET